VRVILLCSWVIQEFPNLIKVPLSLCVFKLLDLSSILRSVMSINFRSIFLYVSIFSFWIISQISCLLAFQPWKVSKTNRNTLDSHHLVFRAWLCRFGIGMEVYYTRCLTEDSPCLVAFDYESENNVVSQRLVEKLQLPTTFHLNHAWIKFSTWQCVKEVLCDIAPINPGHLLSGWACFVLKHFILMNVPFIWGMRDIKRSRNLAHQDKSARINVGWRRKQKKKE